MRKQSDCLVKNSQDLKKDTIKFKKLMTEKLTGWPMTLKICKISERFDKGF